MWNLTTRIIKCKKPNINASVLRLHTIPDTIPRRLKSLKERLEELNYKDPKSHYRVDIGLPPQVQVTKSDLKNRRRYIKNLRTNKELEKASRTLTLEVDLDEVAKEWQKTLGPEQIMTVAEHYGIYNDLYGDAFFYPYVNLEIGFPLENDLEAPVHRGNVVKPAEAAVQPNVRFEAEKNTLWTLILTNLDGHLTEDNMEYVHWFVGNIPGNDLSKGEVIWDYLQPFPPRGVGFQRLVFVLYKQEKNIDYSSLRGKLPRLELKDRTFSTLEFYRARQDDMTPAGLAFFQSDWDTSVIKTFHEKLNMEEPIFEYDHEQPYVRKPVWFPRKQPFDLYLDKYKDPRDIAKRYLLKKVEKLNPFEKPKKPFPYPNIYRFEEDQPSWLNDQIKRDRIGLGRIVDQREDEYE